MSPVYAIEAQILLHGFELASQIDISNFVLKSNNLKLSRSIMQ